MFAEVERDGQVVSVTEKPTTVTFLGTGSVVPDPEGDTASYLINRTHLIDTGWYAAINMLRFEFTPMDLEYVFLTHCHHDHYMGLAGILFYLRMRASERPDRPPIKVVGPAQDIQRVVDLARAYLQTERFPDVNCIPEVVALEPGESLDAGALRLDTTPTIHPVQSMALRFTCKRTEAAVTFSGDTAYHPPVADLALGCDLLVHECSCGGQPGNPSDRCGHSGAPDAARIAATAGVQRLALVHCRRSQHEEVLEAARRIFADAFVPGGGEALELVPSSAPSESGPCQRTERTIIT